MKIKYSIAILVSALVLACSTNPFTVKSTLALVPNSQIFPSSFAQYNQFLSENKLVKGTTEAQMITRVGTY